jgi:hypothetical protein
VLAAESRLALQDFPDQARIDAGLSRARDGDVEIGAELGECCTFVGHGVSFQAITTMSKVPAARVAFTPPGESGWSVTEKPDEVLPETLATQLCDGVTITL